jgi:hypothetical protein
MFQKIFLTAKVAKILRKDRKELNNIVLTLRTLLLLNILSGFFYLLPEAPYILTESLLSAKTRIFFPEAILISAMSLTSPLI